MFDDLRIRFFPPEDSNIKNDEKTLVVNNYYEIKDLSTVHNEVEENMASPDESFFGAGEKDIKSNNPAIITIRRYYSYLNLKGCGV